MAHIRCTLRPHFTGQVGPVRFKNGHGETSDPEALAYFEANPDEYDVTDTTVPNPADPTDLRVSSFERVVDFEDPETDPQE